MQNPQAVINKLRRPPAVHNWARSIRSRTDETAFSLYDFAVNGPRHSLTPVTAIIRDVVVDGINDDMAFESVSRIRHGRVRQYGEEILTAMLPHIRAKGWKGVQIFKDMVEYYPISSSGVRVPVRPTFVVNDQGRLVPHFVIGWTKIALTHYQKRILSTLIHEAILTLEEFEDCDAIVTCVPRYPFSKTERYVVEWNVSDYPVLTDDEKSDLFERYGNALIAAEQMILGNLE